MNLNWRENGWKWDYTVKQNCIRDPWTSSSADPWFGMKSLLLYSFGFWIVIKVKSLSEKKSNCKFWGCMHPYIGWRTNRWVYPWNVQWKIGKIKLLTGCNDQFIFLASHANKSQIILWVKISNLKSFHSADPVIEYDLMGNATYSWACFVCQLHNETSILHGCGVIKSRTNWNTWMEILFLDSEWTHRLKDFDPSDKLTTN